MKGIKEIRRCIDLEEWRGNSCEEKARNQGHQQIAEPQHSPWRRLLDRIRPKVYLRRSLGGWNNLKCSRMCSQVSRKDQIRVYVNGH